MLVLMYDLQQFFFVEREDTVGVESLVSELNAPISSLILNFTSFDFFDDNMKSVR